MKPKPISPPAIKTPSALGSDQSSIEKMQGEAGRINKMMRLPQFQGMRGAKSFTMKHQGSPKRTK